MSLWDEGGFDDLFERGLGDSDALSPLELVEPGRPTATTSSRWALHSQPASDDDASALGDARGADVHGDDDVDDAGEGRDADTGLSYDGARRVYGLLCAMAHVDGRIAPAQRRELEDFQEYLGLSAFAAGVLEDEARRSRVLRLGLRAAELDLLMGALIDMAAADGRLSAREERLLERVNERARWSGDEVALAVVRALERARSGEAALEPASASDLTRDDPFGRDATTDSAPFGLEDSGEGDLVLPELSSMRAAPRPASSSRGATSAPDRRRGPRAARARAKAWR